MNLPIITPEPGSGHEIDPNAGIHPPVVGGIFNPPVFGAGPAATGGELLGIGGRRTGIDPSVISPANPAINPNAPRLGAGIGDWLGQPGPFGLTYGTLGLIALGIILLVSGGKK